ncbi:hypothetical protein DMC30DRAFT_182656 [Rhodotorula diobovata]|uniref:Uncharacterized protein n=1 Tax=Rhodotorula diobovata TaxID=5288 RepID=A0A5C5FY17_9BASI|nr:hypothetical protein DMC30DRAFT_182656 [Rhodotorula diobovata]
MGALSEKRMTRLAPCPHSQDRSHETECALLQLATSLQRLDGERQPPHERGLGGLEPYPRTSRLPLHCAGGRDVPPRCMRPLIASGALTLPVPARFTSPRKRRQRLVEVGDEGRSDSLVPLDLAARLLLDPRDVGTRRPHARDGRPALAAVPLAVPLDLAPVLGPHLFRARDVVVAQGATESEDLYGWVERAQHVRECSGRQGLDGARDADDVEARREVWEELEAAVAVGTEDQGAWACELGRHVRGQATRVEQEWRVTQRRSALSLIRSGAAAIPSLRACSAAPVGNFLPTPPTSQNCPLWLTRSRRRSLGSARRADWSA